MAKIPAKEILNEIVDVELKDLVDFDKNPRVIGKVEMEKLKNSIKKFGYVDLIIVDENNTVIGGNQRVRAMKEMEINIPIKAMKISGLTNNDKKALNLALNKISGEWDYDLLDVMIEELKTENYDIDLTGFVIDDEEGVEIPDVDIRGEVKEKKEFIVITFDSRKEYEGFCTNCDIKEGARQMEYSVIKEILGIE